MPQSKTLEQEVASRRRGQTDGRERSEDVPHRSHSGQHLRRRQMIVAWTTFWRGTGVGFVPPPPVWSPNGRELFFHDAEGRILVTEYSVHDETFVPGKPSVWSPTRIRLLGGSLNMGLHPDGRRFAVFPRDEGPAEIGVHMTLLLNFFDEFRRRIEAGR